MSLADDVLLDAALKTLADDVEEALKGSRAALKKIMREMRIKSLSAELPDGTQVATVTLAGGQSAPRITSERKFLEWVQKTHPSQTEVIVRPGYTEQLLKQMAKEGLPVDPGTGEMVPGIEFLPTEPYVTPSFSRRGVGGREMIRRAWRDGELALPSLPELAAGGDGEADAA